VPVAETVRGDGAQWKWLAVAASAPLVVTLCVVMWRTPYPISEAVAQISDSWPPSSASVLANFASRREMYRPLYFASWAALLKWTGSLDVAMLAFRIVEVGSIAALAGMLLWRLRIRNAVDAAAATLAVAVLVGMPGFRDNLELPLLFTLIAMPIAVAVYAVAEHEHRPWHGLLLVALTFVAVGFKEQGLVVVPVIVIAWLTGAPGVRRFDAAAVVAATLMYLGFRFHYRGTWPAFGEDVGLWFGQLSVSEATARFGAHPLPMYAYSAMATLSNILFSEPTSGTFIVVKHLKEGTAQPWELNHVLSSTALAILVAWWGIGAVRRGAGARWSVDARLFAIFVAAVAASGALGFNYSRDRHGGMAVVFFAFAAFEAVRALAARAQEARQSRATTIAVALLLLAGAWQLRAIGTLEHERLLSWKNHREWITNLQLRRVASARDADYLQVLDAMVNQGTRLGEPEPTHYPAWFVALIGKD
jgi:hypothetical protein